ncbi:MAG: CHAD domain-containing protein [Thermoguttaceae bacterium]
MATQVDTSYRLLAAKHLRKQAKQLAGQLDGVRRAEDIEYIHRARVASRRLRAGMRMFADCFDAELLKKWRKQIRRVTTGLGDARDKDVQIEFLCGVLDGLREKACYPGIARLMVKLERRRERLQTKVVAAVDRLQAAGVLCEMPQLMKRILAEAKMQGVVVRSDCSLARTGQHILDRLEAMLPYQESLADAEAQQQHHAMRIATKQFRYTLEISKPVYGASLDDSIAAVRKLQTFLGTVHDCDVWAGNLDAFAAEEEKRIRKHFGHAGPFARLNVGIEHLRQDRRRRRGEVFRELVTYWEELKRNRQWEEMAHIVRHGEAESVEPEAETAASDGLITPLE